MFEGLDLSNMAKIAEQMQERAEEIKQKSKETIITSKGGGGMVSISADGSGEIVDITIDDSLMEDKESLQILLISTFNDLSKSIEENKKLQALNMLNGMNPFGMQ
jgi:DNA-binding YbaB/EbfC family protein